MGIIEKLFGKKSEEEGVIEANVVSRRETRVKLRTMVLERYNDVEKVLDRFRKGDVIIVLRVTPLRTKDVEELKKAVNRLKTHCEVTGAELAALDDDWILLIPPVVQIERR